MENIKEIISYNVRRLRKKRGWTQTDLAEAAGYSLRGIQGIETMISIPRVETLNDIAAALGVTHLDLITAPNPPPKNKISDMSPDELVDKIKSTLSQAQGYQLSKDEEALILALRGLGFPQITKRLAERLKVSPSGILAVIELTGLIAAIQKKSTSKPVKRKSV